MPDGVGRWEPAPNCGDRAVEEGPCPSAVSSISPGAVDLVEEEAFDRFGRHISIIASVFNIELLRHRVGQFFDVIRHFSKSPDHRPKYPAALAVGVELRLVCVDHCVGIAGTVVRVRAAWWKGCLLYTSPSPRDYAASRMPSSA